MQDWIDFAQELAHESGKVVRTYFGTQLEVMHKADRTSVTAADLETEALMRGMIEKRFPEHRIVGEEGGSSGKAGADYQWLLDPIDGTESFIRGVPLFGTLIALLERGRPIVGAINLPVQQELLLGARERPTTLNGRPARVSGTRQLAEATLVFTCPVEMIQEGLGENYQQLRDRVGLTRTWGDCYGHFMVATGRADIMIDPILNPWDYAALKPCVEGAGGRISDRNGQVHEMGESAISSNGHLHDAVIALLKE